ncbi:hypothetical protein EVAR_50282_1 [Eumeta japonica]|uniref:Uncharacterized protein n=1 Tax=Eumeta variegata TaxID=151549 RepID=A0A4C1XSA6_EUMVA|nr:hypothetical protein EVAR_50282_1 [Eumeta japonica]
MSSFYHTLKVFYGLVNLPEVRDYMRYVFTGLDSSSNKKLAVATHSYNSQFGVWTWVDDKHGGVNKPCLQSSNAYNKSGVQFTEEEPLIPEPANSDVGPGLRSRLVRPGHLGAASEGRVPELTIPQDYPGAYSAYYWHLKRLASVDSWLCFCHQRVDGRRRAWRHAAGAVLGYAGVLGHTKSGPLGTESGTLDTQSRRPWTHRTLNFGYSRVWDTSKKSNIT